MSSEDSGYSSPPKDSARGPPTMHVLSEESEEIVEYPVGKIIVTGLEVPVELNNETPQDVHAELVVRLKVLEEELAWAHAKLHAELGSCANDPIVGWDRCACCDSLLDDGYSGGDSNGEWLCSSCAGGGSADEEVKGEEAVELDENHALRASSSSATAAPAGHRRFVVELPLEVVDSEDESGDSYVALGEALSSAPAGILDPGASSSSSSVPLLCRRCDRPDCPGARMSLLCTYHRVRFM